MQALKGKAIVVTGGGRGIGREIALQAAAAGAAVVVNDLGAELDGDGCDAAPAQIVADEIVAAGGRAVASIESVAEPRSAERIVQTCVDSFGAIDGVVNNAGILRDAIVHRMTVEQWRAVMAVHLDGSFYVSRAACAQFRQQGRGALVHMSSPSGLIGNVGQANYAAAKLGLVGLSRSIALDLARHGVRSNCVAPSAYTRMIDSVPAATPEQLARKERLRSGMTASRVAPLVLHLLSDAAADISGQVFAVRQNEIFLMSQPRPVRSVYAAQGWSLATLAAQGMPALRASFTPLESFQQVFAWDPV